jgi:hypothetical protein
MKVKSLIFQFNCEQTLKTTPDKLRGFFANNFGEYTLLHNHLNDNKLFYKTPLIQYKILDNMPFVLGINEGAEILQKIYEDINYIKINYEEYKITEKIIIFRTDYYGISNTNISYTFITPWLALNQINYEKYLKLGLQEKRKELLEHILIGNIISMSKSFNYTVSEKIKANLFQYQEVQTKFKGIPLLGFLATFSVNFNIPDFWGIGKSISKGFGTIKKL